MPDFSLVPVDYQPEFDDFSLIPVDHDPFGVGEIVQQAQAQQTQVQAQPLPTQFQPPQPQSQSPPLPPAAGAGQPDIGAPAVGVGTTDPSQGGIGLGPGDAGSGPNAISDQGGTEPPPFNGYANPTLKESLVNKVMMEDLAKKIEADLTRKTGSDYEGGQSYRFVTTTPAVDPTRPIWKVA